MQANKKTVAILGNGIVGVTVGKGFADLGYQVIFGTRDSNSEKSKAALAAVNGASADSYQGAVKAADFVFLALPWQGLQDSLELAGADHFAGKLVIDAVNPLDFSSGAPQLAIGFSDSAGELAQRLLPQARVVKAFNIVNTAHMVQPKLPDGQADIFIAGNDVAAKQEVTSILREFGWRTAIDIGDIAASRLLESLAVLWITYAVKHQHWTHAFSLLGQPAVQVKMQ